MTTAGSTKRDTHLLSPDGRWYWDGVSQSWTAVEEVQPPEHPAVPAPPPARPRRNAAPTRGLSSFVGSVRSEDLAYGQTVLVWARWILIGTGLVLSFWSPADLLILQVQLAAIIALAFGNFYLHVQLLRGHPAIDNIVYAASVGDLIVITSMVLVQGGYPSNVFVFYFAAVVGISVAFPTLITTAYTAVVVCGYGIICLATASADELPAVFTRLLMIAAIAVCGNLFARNESHRREQAIRIYEESLDESGAVASTEG
jgi:hypothetical protein